MPGGSRHQRRRRPHRFDPSKGLLSTKAAEMRGEMFQPGDPLPEDWPFRTLQKLWIAGRADYPGDILFDLESKHPVAEPDTLLGSDILPSDVTILDSTIPLGDLVSRAFIESELTVEQWNDLPDEERESALVHTLNELRLESQKPTPSGEPGAHPGEPPFSVEHSGGGWYTISGPGDFSERVQGKDKATGRLDELNGASG